MERVEKIRNHPLFLQKMELIESLEKERIYCGHSMTHLLDVARIGYIDCLEKDLPYSKETIYVTALLHDIGRAEEYQGRGSHHEQSGIIAKRILLDCDFKEAEIKEILEAIAAHGTADTAKRLDLSGILYRGDKASRDCHGCMAQSTCHWTKKNMELKY